MKSNFTRLVILLVLAVVAGFFATDSFAYSFCGTKLQSPKNPPPEDPTPSPCEPCLLECKKSPCYAKGGVYDFEVVDLEVPTAGLPITIGRRYTSTSLGDGALGIGWNTYFGARLSLTSSDFGCPVVGVPSGGGGTALINLCTYQPVLHTVVVAMPDGAKFQFIGTPPASGLAETFTSVKHDNKLVRFADGTYDLTWKKDGTVMRFSSDGFLVSIGDAYQNTLILTRDGGGKLQQISDPVSSRFINLIWGPNGRLANLQDHASRVITYTYATNGTLISVADPEGRLTKYEYSANAPYDNRPLMTAVKDPWDRILTTVTWAGGNVKSYTEQGQTYSYTYNPNGTTTKSDSSGAVWSFAMNEDGQVTTETLPGGATIRKGFDGMGRIEYQTDEVGVTTSYVRNSSGDLLSITKATGLPEAVKFVYEYDTTFTDRVTSITPRNPSTNALDPNWQGWKYEYHAAGSPSPGALHRLLRVRDDGVTADIAATYSHDTKGRVTAVADALGATTDYNYDTLGNLTSVTTPANNDAGTRPVTSYGYDNLDRVTSVTDPLGKITSYTYDRVGRIVTTTLPKPAPSSPLNFTTGFAYDRWDAATGLLFTDVTDPNGRMTKQGHDAFGRLLSSIDALNNATAYAYTKDMLSSITDANGNVTRYEYDVRGQLTATVFPDGARETYTYYADGLLKTKTDRKLQTLTYEYDRMKRLVKKIYPNASTIVYSYQGQKLTQVADGSVSPSETHSFGFDSAYRVISNTQGPRGTISYTYTPGDAPASYTVLGGPTASYGYYPDGSLNTIQWTPVTGQFKYAYTPNGQYGTITFPNGQTRVHSYDEQGRLTQLANLHPTAGTLATYGYAYDLNHTTGQNTMLGQRVSMTATVPSQGLAGALTKYVYDASYQLTRADYPAAAPFNGEVHSWTYDSIGNRLTSTANGVTTNYAYQKIGTNPNNWQRLTSDGASSYTYDANGNTLTQGSLTFGWDAENRMMNIGAGATASYAYDYQGRRAAKTAGATIQFLYDGLNLLNESGPASTSYLFGPGIDEPLATDRSGAVSYLAADALGSITLAGDSAATTQNSYTYDAWGSPRSTTEAFAQPFRYTAREAGDVANQWFYRARFYAPSSGRFLAEDPLREPQITAYTYVINNPLSHIDPSGMKLEICCRPIRRTGILGTMQHCFIRGNPPLSAGKPGPASTLSAIPLPLISPANWKARGRKLCKIRNYEPDRSYKGNNCQENDDTEENRKCLQCANKNFPSGNNYDESAANSNTFARSLAKKCGLTGPKDMYDPLESPGKKEFPIRGCE